MEWIASMPGPWFLALYAAVMLVTIAGCWAAVRQPPDDGPGPLAPSTPNPYEIAYLRGGEDEIARLAVIDLADRGLLREQKGKGWNGKTRVKVVEAGAAERPPANLRPVLDLFRTQLDPLEKILRRAEMRAAVKSIADPIAVRYRDYFLVKPDRRIAVRLIGLAAILGLGGFKLADALAEGRTNVGFLCVFALAAVVSLWAATSSRLNAAGREFLRKTQQAYGDLKTKPKIDARPLQHADLMLAVGLFGAPVLLGGADVHFAEMLGARAMRDSGSTGGSCSSCSSSDGGGDGGCGGGCGGCGGD